MKGKCTSGRGSIPTASIALSALKIPPDATFPCNEGNGSVVLINISFICAYVSVGWAALSNAAAPATKGAAILVPE